MTLEEIKQEVREQHQARVAMGRTPRRGIYAVICRPKGNGGGLQTVGGSCFLPAEFCGHPSLLNKLVSDHNGERVLQFFGSRRAAREQDLTHPSKIAFRSVGAVELG